MKANQIQRICHKVKKTSLLQVLLLFLLLPQTYSQEATAEIEEEQTVQEQIQEVQIKSLSYVKLTFHSDINNFDAAKKFIKGTEIFENDLPKLKNRKYDFYAWKANGTIITFPFTPTEDTQLVALWNEKASDPSSDCLPASVRFVWRPVLRRCPAVQRRPRGRCSRRCRSGALLYHGDGLHVRQRSGKPLRGRLRRHHRDDERELRHPLHPGPSDAGRHEAVEPGL